jgi:teichuronic acid biosynthesis glycosyltransferase TuaG
MATISVFIPLYNTEKFIAKTVNSVRQQSYADWELIILDDCSTDQSFQICCEMSLTDKRIKVFKNDSNLGMMRNWNKGLSMCNSPYFAKLDCDDWWHPDMLNACLDILEKNEDIGLVMTRYAVVKNDQDLGTTESNGLPDFAKNKSFTGVQLVKRGVYGMFADGVLRQGIGLIRKKAVEELGPFLLIDSGDTEMWFRIASRYKVYGIDEVYYYYRIWENSFSRAQILGRNKNERNLFETREMIIRYYYENQLISDKEKKEFLKDNQHEYSKHLIYKNRVEGKTGTALLLMLKTFARKPFTTFTFYFKRMTSRLK